MRQEGRGVDNLAKMDIKNIDISKLNPALYNPRQMSDLEIEKLKDSIQTFEIVEPIIVNKDMTIIGGHQRVKAVKMLGWKDIPCIVLNLDKKRERLLNLALNRIVGSWDESKLVKLVREIQDYPEVKLSGLSDVELDMLSVQYDLIFGDELQDTENEEAIKKLFELKQRVPIDVEKPQVSKKESKIAFYTDTFEEWEKIKKHFGTTKKSELDTKKLLKML